MNNEALKKRKALKQVQEARAVRKEVQSMGKDAGDADIKTTRLALEVQQKAEEGRRGSTAMVNTLTKSSKVLWKHMKQSAMPLPKKGLPIGDPKMDAVPAGLQFSMQSERAKQPWALPLAVDAYETSRELSRKHPRPRLSVMVVSSEAPAGRSKMMIERDRYTRYLRHANQAKGNIVNLGFSTKELGDFMKKDSCCPLKAPNKLRAPRGMELHRTSCEA